MDRKLSLSQRILRFFTSESKFERIRRESLTWQFRCDCGKESSIWEIGGIRAGAKGEPSVSTRCPACGILAMRKLFRKAALAMLLLMVLIGSTQCKKDCESVSMGNLSVEADVNNMIPYTAGDTLVFKDLEGDSIMYCFEWRITEGEHFYYEHANSTDGCQGNYYTYETNNIRLIGPVQADDFLAMTLYTGNPYATDTPPKMMLMGFSLRCQSLLYIFNGFYKLTPPTLVTAPAYLNVDSEVLAFHDSIDLGPRTFAQVFELSDHPYSDLTGIRIIRAYFNSQQGLVGFVTADGKQFYLKP